MGVGFSNEKQEHSFIPLQEQVKLRLHEMEEQP
jgi:hypothetical protein